MQVFEKISMAKEQISNNNDTHKPFEQTFNRWT